MNAIEIRIRRLPVGHIEADDFGRVEVALPDVKPGEVRVRNTWMSLDPYMRILLGKNDGDLNVGGILSGAAVGIVEESRERDFPAGTLVASDFGWRTAFVATPVEASLRLIGNDFPSEWHLGILGLTGITAWRGIEEVLAPARGQTLVITGAAGAVGSVACQLAKARGVRVLASAGSDEKAVWLRNELGVDAVVNHRKRAFADFLDEAAPNGIDACFDNVGGAMLEAMLPRMTIGARIALCGAISQYEQNAICGPANFFTILERALRLEGFSTFTLTEAHRAAIVSEIGKRITTGSLVPHQTVIDGIESAPHAMARVFENGFTGKLVVRL